MQRCLDIERTFEGSLFVLRKPIYFSYTRGYMGSTGHLQKNKHRELGQKLVIMV